MREPFKRTMEIVNGMLKPGAQLLKESPFPPYEDYAHLLAAVIDSNVEHYEDIAAAMADENRKVALYEYGMIPQIFYAFDCAPLCLESYPSFFTGVDMDTVYEFIDVAEEAGVTSDACSIDRVLLGAALSDELPDNSFFVTSSAPCDGTRIVYPILDRILDCPMLYLDAPFRYDREAIRYYARQLRDDLIPFLEKVTNKRFDIDRFREVVVESNKAYELMVDIHDTYAVKPSPHPSSMKIIPHSIFVIGAGNPRHTEVLKCLSEDASRRVKEGCTQGPFEEKHRVLWVHVPPTYDRELFSWMEEQFGAMVVANLGTVCPTLGPIDTSSLDTMLEGAAWQGLEMTMSQMRYDTKKFIDFWMYAYDHYSCDCVIITMHVGCHSILGARGFFRKVCRSKDVPVLFLEFDFNDDRVLPREVMRRQIEEFFTSVVR